MICSIASKQSTIPSCGSRPSSRNPPSPREMSHPPALPPDGRRCPTSRCWVRPILVQIPGAALQPLQPVGMCCRRRRISRSPTCPGPAADAVWRRAPPNCCTSSRCRFRPHGAGAQHHPCRAIATSLIFGFNRRRQHHFPMCRFFLRHAAGGIRRPAGSVRAAARSQECGKLNEAS